MESRNLREKFLQSQEQEEHQKDQQASELDPFARNYLKMNSPSSSPYLPQIYWERFQQKKGPKASLRDAFGFALKQGNPAKTLVSKRATCGKEVLHRKSEEPESTLRPEVPSGNPGLQEH